jgi:hypothetical protein
VLQFSLELLPQPPSMGHIPQKHNPMPWSAMFIPNRRDGPFDGAFITTFARNGRLRPKNLPVKQRSIELAQNAAVEERWEKARSLAYQLPCSVAREVLKRQVCIAD